MTAPAPILPGVLVNDVRVNGQALCALAVDSRVFCSGRLGDASVASDASINPVLGGSFHASQVALGGAHACAIADRRQVYCWGNASDGQTGQGRASTTPNPALVIVP
jgi:alpha-tubulin suppressor-like RCC1 family protein